MGGAILLRNVDRAAAGYIGHLPETGSVCQRCTLGPTDHGEIGHEAGVNIRGLVALAAGDVKERTVYIAENIVDAGNRHRRYVTVRRNNEIASSRM